MHRDEPAEQWVFQVNHGHDWEEDRENYFLNTEIQVLVNKRDPLIFIPFAALTVPVSI